jgi:hypothetical protein
MSEHNNNNNNNRRADAAPAPTETPEPEYKVGPGHPPKEYRFKPGQSGNPKGLKRKPKPMAPDLKAALERALREPIKLKQGERERTMTMAEAGIKQLVAQFVKGNHQARRDLIVLCDKLGIDLMAGQQQALQEAVAANHEAILNAYVDRQYDRVVTRAPVFAPAELLDDDSQPQNQN